MCHTKCRYESRKSLRHPRSISFTFLLSFSWMALLDLSYHSWIFSSISSNTTLISFFKSILSVSQASLMKDFMNCVSARQVFQIRHIHCRRQFVFLFICYPSKYFFSSWESYSPEPRAPDLLSLPGSKQIKNLLQVLKGWNNLLYKYLKGSFLSCSN